MVLDAVSGGFRAKDVVYYSCRGLLESFFSGSS